MERGWATHPPLSPCLAVVSRILGFLVLGCVERMTKMTERGIQEGSRGVKCHVKQIPYHAGTFYAPHR